MFTRVKRTPEHASIIGIERDFFACGGVQVFPNIYIFLAISNLVQCAQAWYFPLSRLQKKKGIGERS